MGFKLVCKRIQPIKEGDFELATKQHSNQPTQKISESQTPVSPMTGNNVVTMRSKLISRIVSFNFNSLISCSLLKSVFIIDFEWAYNIFKQIWQYSRVAGGKIWWETVSWNTSTRWKRKPSCLPWTPRILKGKEGLTVPRTLTARSTRPWYSESVHRSFPSQITIRFEFNPVRWVHLNIVFLFESRCSLYNIFKENDKMLKWNQASQKSQHVEYMTYWCMRCEVLVYAIWHTDVCDVTYWCMQCDVLMYAMWRTDVCDMTY